MKSHYLFAVFFIATLLAAAAVTADPRDPPMGPDHPMDPNNPPMGPHDPIFRPDGFMGASEYVNITGDISIGASIDLSIVITPTADALKQMKEHRPDLPPSMQQQDNLTNFITISVTQLVEFNDTLNDGFTSDDAVLSSYVLNSTTLNDIVRSDVDNGTIYTITSTSSGLFTMTAQLNYENDVLNAWKWSFDINYPFVSTTSKLAVLNEIDNSHRQMMEQAQESIPNNGNEYRYTHSYMNSSDHMFPVFLQWDDYATVDGVKQNVTATGVPGTLALAFLQGSLISYDPRIGIVSENIISFELLFQSLASNFLASIKSPTVLGLTIGVVVVIAAMSFGFFRRK